VDLAFWTFDAGDITISRPQIARKALWQDDGVNPSSPMAVDGQESAEIAVKKPRRKQAIGDGPAYVPGRYDSFGLPTEHTTSDR
jgi:hypothetical protein